jgi:hypothetical protein
LLLAVEPILFQSFATAQTGASDDSIAAPITGSPIEIEMATVGRMRCAD